MHAGRVFVALVTVLLLAAPGRAQVDCSDPDNLCTGDPCVIPALELPSDCTVDFGTLPSSSSGGCANRRKASSTSPPAHSP